MRAIVCQHYGPPEELVLTELPDPEPAPGQVVVAVRAAAVNFPDVLLIDGRYQLKIPVPFTPGSELAGDVIAVGDGVALAVGDRVVGTSFIGAFAERAALPASTVTAIPDGVDYAAAAGFGITYRTAYHALRSVAGVSAGDWVVVLGAAGGVGLAAVDLGVALGLKVLAAASGPEKLAVCTERGAAAVVDYDREDLKTRIREAKAARRVK